ncbi:putative polyhydroxyalkanoate system protein [Polaromonas sp. CG_9.5]|uniref:polyhydroxyalkanoic acid system family protein n=1 Tax=Polaromonas sp. CG_9.5 TaxID=3071705 RepID=UPI002E03E6ED|nr:putative polyhydroxyalkanoate system protein [Polaromonas sp. CG_9.5]
MADIHIEREHALGLPEARKIAFKWAERAEKEFDMECTYEEGTTSDLLSFSRSGVQGTLNVTANRFELSAQLGFLAGMFKEKIEAEIAKNLDTLIDKKTAATQLAAKKSAAKKNLA